jgi:hypothetical protein
MLRFKARSTPMRACITKSRPCGTDQATDRGLPLLEVLLSVWQLHDVVSSVLESNELAAVGERDRIVETAGPLNQDAAMTGQRRRHGDRTLCRACGAAGR